MAAFEITAPALLGFVRRMANGDRVVREELATSHKKARLAVEAGAKRVVRVRQGHLRRSVTGTTEVSPMVITSQVGTALPYGRMLDEGTGIYGPSGAPITPKNGRFLVFQVGGKTVFARSVRGVPGDKWLTGTFERLKPQIRREFQQVPKRVVARLRAG